MDTTKVKKLMEEKHITVEMMAKELGMNPATYYRKMQKDGGEFSALDLMVFKRVLDITTQDAVDILLS